MQIVMEAAGFAVIAHGDQKRSGSKRVPYVQHCFDVARRLAEVDIETPEVLAAAILHDVLEDCPHVDHDAFHNQFGSEIYTRVQQLTLPSWARNDFAAKIKYQTEILSEMDPYTRCIKVADKTSNVTSLLLDPPSWSLTAQLGYANDAKKVVDAAMGFTPFVPMERLYSVFCNMYDELCLRKKTPT